MKALFQKIALLRRSHSFSLRLQLSVCYTFAFAFLLVLTGGVFYRYLETSLEASVDTDLHIRAQEVASGLILQNGNITSSEGELALPGFASPALQLSPAADMNQETFVRLLDTHGRLLSETKSFQVLQVPSLSVTQSLHGTPWQGTIVSSTHQEVRLYSCALIAQGKPLAVLQVGASLASLHLLLHQLVAALLASGFLVLLACAMGGYWLAGRSFAPIQRLAETARMIQAGDLHQRVPVPAVRDEVQYLALTLNEMLDSLEQSFFQQRRFVADASHELRTPVAAIRNKAEVAFLRTRSQDEYRQILGGIHAESERLGHLIHDLLALARGDEGQARFEYEPVHLDLLIESVVANAEEQAKEQEVELTIEELPSVTLLGDEARLIQVLMNLVENAISYTNRGGQVYVYLTVSPSQVQIAIRDTGIGIAPEHLPHIFERFYRADAARRRTRGSSSGLGLAIVEWIIHAHGGQIDVESEVGRGSCFTVMLPLHPTLDGSLKERTIWKRSLPAKT